MSGGGLVCVCLTLFLVWLNGGGGCKKCGEVQQRSANHPPPHTAHFYFYFIFILVSLPTRFFDAGCCVFVFAYV